MSACLYTYAFPRTLHIEGHGVGWEKSGTGVEGRWVMEEGTCGSIAATCLTTKQKSARLVEGEEEETFLMRVCGGPWACMSLSLQAPRFFFCGRVCRFFLWASMSFLLCFCWACVSLSLQAPGVIVCVALSLSLIHSLTVPPARSLSPSLLRARARSHSPTLSRACARSLSPARGLSEPLLGQMHTQ